MTLAADALAVLQRWRAPDPQQERLRAAYVDVLRDRDDAVWRTCLPDHLTASAVVVDRSRQRVLLGLHRKAGLWLQMGGHCEPADATLAEAALREAREESGIASLTLLPGPVRLDRHSAPCSAQARFHLDVQFVALADADAVEVCSAESLALRWSGYDELPEPTDDAVRRLVAAAAALVGEPLLGRDAGAARWLQL